MEHRYRAVSGEQRLPSGVEEVHGSGTRKRDDLSGHARTVQVKYSSSAR